MGPHRYYEEEEPSFRRHSTRGHGYPLSHDRDLPPAPLHISYDGRRGFHSSLHEPRSNDNSSDQDSSSRPRSRIPVACGRCRKRKIRCSGDNGGPCSNCKSAGNDECTFLRVSSTVATLKIDNPIPEYYDNAAASRIQCRMVSQGPSQYMTTHSPSTINYDSYQYRNNSVSSYQQYPGKQYYSGASPFAEYDENVDYGLQTSYQLMAPDHIQATSPNSNYGTTGQLRGWTPGPQLPKSNSLFLEQEQPQYGHGQLPYNNAGNFPMRTSMGTDTKGMGLSAMPILPTPVSGNDRVLPNPTANRPAQMNAFLVRNNDGMVPMAQQTYQPFGNYMATNMLNNVKGSNHTAVSENAYSMPMASASPESISSSQIYTGSENSVSLSQHQSEIYSPNDGLHYHTSEPSESSYGHSNSSRRESHSSRTTQHEGSLPSHSEGELSNGHHYVPYQHLSANYPTPPMNIPPPAVLHPRSSLQPVQ